jgi:hypothetical protein
MFVGKLQQSANVDKASAGKAGDFDDATLATGRQVLTGNSSPDKRVAREFTVPKLYPSFGNAAFFALLATIGINNLRGVNTAQ